MREKISNLIIKARWYILLLVPILCIGVFALNIHKAGFETDWKMWFDEDSHIIRNYDHFKDSFGNDSMSLLVIHNEKGIFNKEQIENIEKITQLLWKTKSIARVDSLTNFQHVYVSEEDKDEIVVKNLFDKKEKLDKKNLEEKKNIALSEPDLVGRVISKDAKTTIIYAKLVYSKKMKVEKYVQLHKNILKIIQNNSLQGVKYISAGMPAYSNTFKEHISKNVSIFSPLLFICILLLLGIIFRNIWAIFLPLVVVIFSILATLGVSFALGYRLNIMTSMLPIFIIAIGIADSVHFIWLWIHKRRSGTKNTEAVLFALNKNILPAFLTSLTTFFGFISLAISKLSPLQAFGISTAIGTVIAFFVSLSFVPAFLYVINPKVKIKAKKDEQIKAFIKKYTNFIIKHDKTIAIFSTLVILICAIGIFHATIDTDFNKQFSQESQIMKDITFIQKHLGGTIPLETIIDSKEDGGINDPEFLILADKFSREFVEKFDEITNNSSIINVIKKYEMLMQGGEQKNYKIPNSKELVSQYLLLYSLSLPQGMGINTFFDINKRYLRITNVMKVTSEQKKLEMYEWTRKWWSQTKYSASLEGMTIIAGHMRIELTYTMAKSISLALFLVTILLFLSFREKKYILSSFVPNTLPLVLAIGLCGWFNINIDVGMSIVAVMIVGIGVDDTIHFLAKYQDARKKGDNVANSIASALLLGGSAIVFTTIILVIGFGLFTFSDFAMYQNFGFLSSVALLSAMVLDLLLLPAILSILEARSQK